MSEAEWLQTLKAGDEVAVYGGGFSRVPMLTRVERVTATQIVVVGGTKFRRSNGWRVGGSAWSTGSIAPVTQEIRDELADAARRRACFAVIDPVRWRELDTSTLERVAEVLTPASPRPGATRSV